MSEIRRRQSNGEKGERYLKRELQARLPEMSVVRMADIGMRMSEFDIVISRDDKPLVSIETKDMSKRRSLRPDRFGSRISKAQKKRKLRYASKNGVKLIFTTITIRHEHKIGWIKGLVNRPAMCFDYDMGKLAKVIRGSLR